MNDDKDQSLSESTSNDIKSIAKNTEKAIKMSKDTAKAVKTVTKAGAKAATGNFAGAAVDLLKDPETMKNIILIVLTASLILSFVVVAFLYALPTAIFEAMSNFFADVKEQYETNKYSNKNGTSVIMNVIDCVTQIASEAARAFFNDLWNGIKSFFLGLFNHENQTEHFSDDGHELTVIQQEAAEKLAVIQKIVAANDKYLIRAIEVDNAITGKKSKLVTEVQDHFEGDGYTISSVTVSPTILHMGTDGDTAESIIYRLSHIVRDMGNISGPDSLAQMEAKKQEFDDIVQNEFYKESNYDGVNILSLLLTQQGGSLTDMKMSDFMRFLGYYDDSCEYNTKFELSPTTDNSLLASVQDWKGTFKPQYLMEEMESLRAKRTRLELNCGSDEEIAANEEIQEINRKLEEYENEGIALIDWMVELRFPKLDFDSSKMTEVVGDGENEVTKTYYGNTAGEKVIVHEWSETKYVPGPPPASSSPSPTETPTESPSGSPSPSESPSPDESPAPAGRYETSHYRTVDVKYMIQPRDINTIIEYIGLREGAVS